MASQAALAGYAIAARWALDGLFLGMNRAEALGSWPGRYRRRRPDGMRSLSLSMPGEVVGTATFDERNRLCHWGALYISRDLDRVREDLERAFGDPEWTQVTPRVPADGSSLQGEFALWSNRVQGVAILFKGLRPLSAFGRTFGGAELIRLEDLDSVIASTYGLEVLPN